MNVDSLYVLKVAVFEIYNAPYRFLCIFMFLIMLLKHGGHPPVVCLVGFIVKPSGADRMAQIPRLLQLSNDFRWSEKVIQIYILRKLFVHPEFV